MIRVLSNCLELQLHGNLEVLLLLRPSSSAEVERQEHFALVLVYFGNRDLNTVLTMTLEQVGHYNFVILLQLVWE